MFNAQFCQVIPKEDKNKQDTLIYNLSTLLELNVCQFGREDMNTFTHKGDSARKCALTVQIKCFKIRLLLLMSVIRMEGELY